MIKTLAFGNYRSLRDLRLGVGQLTVITGGNGTGKSNVYRACACWWTRPKVSSDGRSREKAGCRPLCGLASSHSARLQPRTKLHV